MKSTMEARVLRVEIPAAAERVYAFAADPARLPLWATAFCRSIAWRDGEWLAETVAGPVAIAFAPHNPYFVLDHVVTPQSGDRTPVRVPMRVLANGAGCEVQLTLFRRPDVDQRHFDADAAMVMADLKSLKRAALRWCAGDVLAGEA